MHVENELVEIMTTGDHEYEEVIEEYEEEIPKLSLTDLAKNSPAQGKPRCITLILNNNWIYIYDVHLGYKHSMETTCINISTMSPTSIGRVAAMLRMSIAWVTCRYSQIGDKYDHSWQNGGKENGDRVGIWVGYWWV